MFESGIENAALSIAACVQLIMVAIIALGSIRTLALIVRWLIAGEALAAGIRVIWLHYAAWILLALEFALAADLLDTIVAPSWDEIGQLGCIAAIRIALGYFLGRDIAGIRGQEERDKPTPIRGPMK